MKMYNAKEGFFYYCTPAESAILELALENYNPSSMSSKKLLKKMIQDTNESRELYIEDLQRVVKS